MSMLAEVREELQFLRDLTLQVQARIHQIEIKLDPPPVQQTVAEGFKYPWNGLKTC